MILEKIEAINELPEEGILLSNKAAFGAAVNNACKMLAPSARKDQSSGGRVVLFAAQSSLQEGFGKLKIEDDFKDKQQPKNYLPQSPYDFRKLAGKFMVDERISLDLFHF